MTRHRRDERGEVGKRVARTYYRLMMGLPAGHGPGVELAADSGQDGAPDRGEMRRDAGGASTAIVAQKGCGAAMCGAPIGCQRKTCKVRRA